MSGGDRVIRIGSCTVVRDVVLLVVLGFRGVFREQFLIADLTDEVESPFDVFLHELEAIGENIFIPKHSKCVVTGLFVVQFFDEFAGRSIVLMEQREKLRNAGCGIGTKEVKHFASRSEALRNIYLPVLSYFSGQRQKISLCALTGDRRLTRSYFRFCLKQIGIKGVSQAMGAKVADAFVTTPLFRKHIDGTSVISAAEKNGAAKSNYGPDSLYPCGNHSPRQFGIRVPGQLGVRGYRVHKCCTRWPHVKAGKCLGGRRRQIQNHRKCKCKREPGHTVNLTESPDGRQGRQVVAQKPMEIRTCL